MESEGEKQDLFKKPSFIGSLKCLKKKNNSEKTKRESPPNSPNENAKVELDESKLNAQKAERDGKQIPLPYKEPAWSGLPAPKGKPYALEVLKNGTILETINLTDQTFWVFGRLPSCDIPMQHPTISRYHAVLQYRSTGTETDGPGFYVYDLGSTHGTFFNNKNNKLKPRVYVRVQVGHMLRLGCSQRSYILTGPDEDREEESELSVTELKQLREDKIKQQQEEYEKAKRAEQDRLKREEEKGVDWGLGEDADESFDAADNPYAQTSNEELYLDDPKKALRGFFEREGFDLEYDCTEQGMGQFLCKVELPLDDDTGRPIVVEVLHRGKKKEAVVQCALEACRTLDRYGVLRQATHESRKRKLKNWEENDYYDSDEDTFLDRTGTIEKKRQMRMKAKEPQKAETYESLLDKETSLKASIGEKERLLASAQGKNDSGCNSNDDEDPLDSYMKVLKETKPDKQQISKLKLELVGLRKELAAVTRFLNIAKPAELPSLQSTSKSSLPIIGKRLKTKPKVQTETGPGLKEEEIVQPQTVEVKETEIPNTMTTKPATPTKLNKSVKETKNNEVKKQKKAEIEKQKGYKEDSTKENYSMWVPPTDQSGDGRTSLNEKYGY